MISLAWSSLWVFRLSATKSGRPYGVMYVSSLSLQPGFLFPSRTRHQHCSLLKAVGQKQGKISFRKKKLFSLVLQISTMRCAPVMRSRSWCIVCARASTRTVPGARPVPRGPGAPGPLRPPAPAPRPPPRCPGSSSAACGTSSLVSVAEFLSNFVGSV